jgi:uncharacterized membrane protein
MAANEPRIRSALLRDDAARDAANRQQQFPQIVHDRVEVGRTTNFDQQKSFRISITPQPLWVLILGAKMAECSKFPRMSVRRQKLNGRKGREQSRRQHSVEELTRRNVETVMRLEEGTQAEQSRFERVADAITNFCGSMRFVAFHVVWYGVWIIGNTALPPDRRWDPFPFALLTLVVSLEAIFLSAFILISQKRDALLSERRAELDLQVNLLSEQENTKVLELLKKIGQKVGVDLTNDPDIEALEEATRPERLLQQIDQRRAKSEKR